MVYFRNMISISFCFLLCLSACQTAEPEVNPPPVEPTPELDERVAERSASTNPTDESVETQTPPPLPEEIPPTLTPTVQVQTNGVDDIIEGQRSEVETNVTGSRVEGPTVISIRPFTKDFVDDFGEITILFSHEMDPD
ncbi:MAG: hypothetical protein AAF633_08345, partial [Chloroflexota bacterium]